MRMISDSKRKEIEKEAQDILKKFGESLKKIKMKSKEKKTFSNKGFREEKSTEKCDDDFRDIMFENAPSKNKDSIIAEKKQW